MEELSAFQRDMLFVVAARDRPHGLAIKDDLEAYRDEEVHHARLYPNLDELAEKGLLSKGQKDRRTNYYTVTQRGRRDLQSRRAWEREKLEITADGE